MTIHENASKSLNECTSFEIEDGRSYMSVTYTGDVRAVVVCQMDNGLFRGTDDLTYWKDGRAYGSDFTAAVLMHFETKDPSRRAA